MVFASSPARVQISTSCGKPLIGTVCENGLFTFATSRYWPLGDGVTLLRIGRAADRRLRAGRGVDRRELAREVVLEQRIVVRVVQQILVGGRRRRLAVVLVHGRPGRHGGSPRARRRGPAGTSLAHDRERCRAASRTDRLCRVDPIRAVHDGLCRSGDGVGDPQLDGRVRGVEEREASSRRARTSRATRAPAAASTR